MMATAVSKRKRDSQDMPNMRAPPGLHAEGHDFTQAYMGTEDDGLGHGDGNIDFTAMLQGTDPSEAVDDPQHHQHHQPSQQHQAQQPEAHAQHGHQTQNHATGLPNEHVTHDHQGPGHHGGQSASDTAAAAMAQYHHTMTVPQSTAEAFMRDVPDSASGDRSLDAGGQPSSAFPDYSPGGKNDSHDQHNGDMSPSNAITSTPGGSKPTVGSDEWHKQRKNNHKEVERRRRETINEGINELSKIVPGCEKNKGSILSRSVDFINQLKENETQNIEKWTLEKLLTEQAITELSSSCDRLKAEMAHIERERDAWRSAAQKAGIDAVTVPAPPLVVSDKVVAKAD